ncbi:FAD-dependent monooxygenase fmqD [Aspergillus novofumigatus IBT 16806]|uniref:FAD binding domain protein n=1 Tax=Aspergillus novofumigatus (strain IBT 16806) TaxID=1392255 RepID=A0A2I1BUM9_ASPN1|nr:FAD binding domain protein [Aspergillus novofumigatus IBT 16806]PKX89072.1 FAD binding domain protein [Aspergillus novofumigatus IBT 16806]
MQFNFVLLLALTRLLTAETNDSSDDVVPRWSTYKNPSYVATIKPASEEDVQNIVMQNAVNIDLNNLKSIDLDLANNLVTIGSGVENAQVYDLLSSVGKETPLTDDRCVNSVGPMLGGGLGVLYGIHGLLLDALVSVRLVTASGDAITVSSTENPDLFWAIRGAGANFGVVTSATYQLYDQSNDGTRISADFKHSPASNRSVIELFHTMDDEFAPELYTSLRISYNRTIHQVTILLFPSISSTLSFVGSPSAAQPWIDKFLALDPIEASIKIIPWHQKDEPEEPLCARGDHYSVYDIGLRQTDPAVMEAYLNNLTEFSASNIWFDGTMVMERHATDAVLAIPESKRGVYPWRDTKFDVYFLTKTPSAEYDDTVDAFIKPIRQEFQDTMGFDTMHVYVNQAFGDEGPVSWYGAHNLPRLVALKQQWDPDNKFGAGCPVPLSLG